MGTALLMQPGIAATQPQPALKLSPAIETAGTDLAAEERALLRIEYRAAQMAATEADTVGEILARVRRMNGTVNEIRALIESWPQPSPPTASASAAAPVVATAPPVGGAKPRSAPALAEKDEASTSGTPLILRALMASVIVFLFWLLGKRRNYAKAQRIKARNTAAKTGTAMVPPVTVTAPTELPPPTESFPPAEPLAPIDHPTPNAPASQTTSEIATPIPPAVPELMPLSFVLTDPAEARQTEAATAPRRAPSDVESIAQFGKRAPASEPMPPPPFELGADKALELAEILVSMGLAQGAVDTLSQHIRDNPKQALDHWLKLLDVYRRSEMRSEFERSAAELHQYFNIQPSAWAANSDGSRSLEDYPRLATQLQQLWPSPACIEFLIGLLEDNRNGTRIGFPQSVAEEILLLEKMLNLDIGVIPA